MNIEECENVQTRGSQRSCSGNERHLRLDNILATQPEVGPVIPDGGYGWIILIASFYIKNVICALPMAYGIFLMFSTIETAARNDGNFNLWSNTFVCTPLLFFSIKTMADPICHTLIRTSKWPRFVSLSGICLICASILLLWLSIIERFAQTTLHVFSGILAGVGSSLILIQIDILISQYFRLKLVSINAVLRVAEYTGIIATSLLLGKHLNRSGLPYSLIWYHLILLICGLVVLFFKKPYYLKGQNTIYNVIQTKHHNEEEDEEDIFSKTTELQSPHSSLSPVINGTDPSTSNSTVPTTFNWEKFSDDETDENQIDELPAPRELFTESQFNNNVTYSFENVDTRTTTAHPDDTNIFLPVPKTGISYSYLKDLDFYNSCLMHIAIKFSFFVFFTLFPSYLYFSVSFLHKEAITSIISVIFIAVLSEALFIGWWKVSRVNRVLPIALLMWIGAFGHFLISDLKKEMVIAVGGILVTTSGCGLEYISKTFIVNAGQSKIEYAALQLICSFSFILFFIMNPTYENCFRFVGLLQFSSGSICFCNFVYSKISNVY